MSERFDAAWLAERAAADAAARAPGPTAAVQKWAAARAQRPLAGVDLACGTAANAAWLAPRLPGPQHWWLVDHDADLLAQAGERALVDRAGRAAGSTVCRADLAPDPAALVGAADLVTASALLDLVSAAWIDALVAACVARGAAALLVLSYDGRFAGGEGTAVEAEIRRRFNADQRRDKGFGPALGPAAAPYAARRFRAAGWHIHLGRSPWRLGAGHAHLQRSLVTGWAGVARDQGGDADGAIAAWEARRRAAIDAGTARLRVGHLDLFAAPAAAGVA